MKKLSKMRKMPQTPSEKEKPWKNKPSKTTFSKKCLGKETTPLEKKQPL